MKNPYKITTTDVRKLNGNRIFKLISCSDGISRQQIADTLDLSLPTVNQNLKSLLDEEFIRFGGNYESTGGRRAQVISINPYARAAVSVNIKNNEIKASLVGLDGNIIDSISVSTHFSPDEKGEAQVVSLVDRIIDKNAVKQENVIGVGVTIPGVFDSADEVILSAPVLGIKDYNINRLKNAFSYECMIINDARAQAFADYWLTRKVSEDGEASSLPENGKFYVMLSDGVGGAYISKDRIKKGLHNRCGEIGHMIIHPGGRKCMCGKCGCFEAYVSSRRLSSDLNISVSEFFDGLDKGNEEYIKVFDEYLDNLTTGINNLYIIVDGNIVIGGPLASYLRKYEDRIKFMLKDKYSFDTDGECISFTACSPDSVDTGAALMYISEFIGNVLI